jgi:hypothetical protein
MAIDESYLYIFEIEFLFELVFVRRLLMVMSSFRMLGVLNLR